MGEAGAEGAEALRTGDSACGKVARSRAAASVGRYKLPFCPQPDTAAAKATTAAIAMPGTKNALPRGLPTINALDIILGL